jgi:hypothetical protein
MRIILLAKISPLLTTDIAAEREDRGRKEELPRLCNPHRWHNFAPKAPHSQYPLILCLILFWGCKTTLNVDY